MAHEPLKRVLAWRARMALPLVATASVATSVGLVVDAGQFTLTLAGWAAAVFACAWLLLPLEFALVSLVCGLVAERWSVWSGTLLMEAVDSSAVATSALAIAASLAVVLSAARLECFRNSARRPWTRLADFTVAGSPVAFVVALSFDARLGLAVGCGLLATFVFAPFGATVLLFKESRNSTASLKHLLGGVYGLAYLLVAQVVLLCIAAPLLALTTRDKWIHIRRLSHRGMHNLFRWFPYGELRQYDIEPRTFERPAVIVSNHQSAIDIPLILSLPADVRLTVSQRVWRAPFLGLAARRMGHVLVEKDKPEVTLERYRVASAAGACIHSFPEGTRSQTAYPRRFRRGAFDIACELRADVLPIVLCNTRTCLARDAYWIGDFRMSVSALPRITPQNFNYNAGPNALMKHAQAVVRAGVVRANAALLDEDFLGRQVRDRYRYQTRRVRADVRREWESCRALATHPHTWSGRGRVLIVGSRHGVLAHALSLSHLLLSVVGWEPDADKVRIAQSSARGNEALDFVCCDPDRTEWVPAIQGALLPQACDASLLDRIRIALEPNGRLVFGPDVEPPARKLAELGFERSAGPGPATYVLGASA